MQNENSKNILLAIVISAIILISWNWIYDKPRIEKFEQEKKTYISSQDSQSAKLSEKSSQNIDNNYQINPSQPLDKKPKGLNLSRKEVIAQNQANRVKIKTAELEGSINLEGLLFDDLTLVNYKQTLDKNSEEVVLLSPKNTIEHYFVNFGFEQFQEISGEINPNKIILPNSKTIWKSDNKILTSKTPINLYWQSPQKVIFNIKVAIDDNYMFTISQSIKNGFNQDISLQLTSEISHFLPQTNSSSYILHEGPIGVFDGILKEQSYTNLKDKKAVDKNNFQAQNGWLGMTDKYWLVSIIPDKNNSFAVKFSDQNQDPGDLYLVNLIGKKFVVASGKEVTFQQKMFAGAKKVALLDKYSKEHNIALFDRAIDFGWYYFLTKPFFSILQLLSQLFGNYGLAILAITVLVKLAMFPLANKSYGALARIKQLQPKIDKIREQYKDKKMQMNREIMEVYKQEKVNPVSGCLPMIIQIPVFFSLYKVLYLTIDMRHAPFYGWIKDLSVPDPTSLFNLFGLLPFDVHGFLAIGIWPILMGITMMVQQKLNPKPSDPAQEKIMKILPIILIFVFSSFPAGLLIYWTWSNILSILQQWFIARKLNK